MPTLSEKYIAGFLDADGCIKVKWNKRYDGRGNVMGLQAPYVSVSFVQRAVADEPLRMMHEQYGGSLYDAPARTVNYSPQTEYELAGKDGAMLLSRIVKFLVIKRHYAELVLDVIKEPRDRSVVIEKLKAERRVKSEPLPNYPSRKWMAGYFDGDGCFNCGISPREHTASITAVIAAAAYDDEGVTIIQKNFGGTLAPIKGREHLVTLKIGMSPSKALQMLNYFGQYLIIKRDQAEFIKSCAQMGSYRDGGRISAVLKQLKAQPHRLSELGAVKALCDSVRRISDDEIKSRRYSTAYYDGMRRHFANRACDSRLEAEAS